MEYEHGRKWAHGELIRKGHMSKGEGYLVVKVGQACGMGLYADGQRHQTTPCGVAGIEPAPCSVVNIINVGNFRVNTN